MGFEDPHLSIHKKFTESEVNHEMNQILVSFANDLTNNVQIQNLTYFWLLLYDICSNIDNEKHIERLFYKLSSDIK